VIGRSDSPKGAVAVVVVRPTVTVVLDALFVLAPPDGDIPTTLVRTGTMDPLSPPAS
jgi:hypothetical protein